MGTVQKSLDSSSLAEVVDRILDKGIVIDAWVRLSLVGVELLGIEARLVIASVDTFLKYAEAIGLLAQPEEAAQREASRMQPPREGGLPGRVFSGSFGGLAKGEAQSQSSRPLRRRRISSSS